MTSALMNSIGVDALLAARDAALTAFRESAERIDLARQVLARFNVSMPEVEVKYSYDDHDPLSAGCPAFDGRIVREVDRLVWLRLFEATNIDCVMDSKSRNEFAQKTGRTRDRYKAPDELPELTEANIAATFERIHADRAEYFARSVENVFRSLSWSHKTNGPTALRPKMIVEYAFSNWSPQTSRGARLDRNESLSDLERVLYILDDRIPPVHGLGIRAMDEIPWGTWVDVPAFDEGESVMRVKIFKKGTTHVVVTRPDLVDAMNRVMARRYPASIAAPARDAPKRRPASDDGGDAQAFYTPEQLADDVVELLRVEDGHSVLEPSCGDGNLALAVRYVASAELTLVEREEDRLDNAALMLAQDAEACENYRPATLFPADFLTLTVERLGLFDRIVMNPPFSGGREVWHVEHALTFLNPRGRLVAIMSAGVKFRLTEPYASFRELLGRYGATITDNEPDAFKVSGTSVATVTVVIDRLTQPAAEPESVAR